MITLVLVRHAKSDWSDPSLSDHDRPLNRRGARDAPRMAEQLARTGFRPDRILASTAVRARATADALAAALDTDVTLVAELYGASSSTLFSHATNSRVHSLILVAHDPGMSDLAEELSDGGITRMPTCAVATFRWGTSDWDVARTTAPVSWNLETPR